MRSSADVYSLRQKVLKHRFGKQREAWDNEHHDDRAIFCAIYDQLMEACEVMKGIENTVICVAFNNRCREDEETLARIADVFAGKEV